MYTQHIYSITINNGTDTARFLKSFDKKIQIGDPAVTIDRDHALGVSVIGDDTESYAYIGTYSTEGFAEMRAKWKELTATHMAPLEYVKDDWVWLVAAPHPDPADRRFTQVIRHQGLPMQRPSRKPKTDQDLKFRPAEPRDYGQIDGDEGQTIIPVEELLRTKPWIDRWFYHYSYLAHHYSECICGCVDTETAREIFIEAFVLTVNEAHMAAGDTIPELVNHMKILEVSPQYESTLPLPSFFKIGTTKIDPSTEQYRIYVKPTLEGKTWVLGPGATFYCRESETQLTELYSKIIGTYGAYYRIP